MTAHGGTNPNASCSRLVSRMVISSALAPARLSLAPCSPPSRTLRAASRWPAAILDRSCAQRLRELRPGRRNGSQPNRETPDQPRDWLSLPTPNSEEATKVMRMANAKIVEDRHDIARPQSRIVCGGIVRFVARSGSPGVYQDQLV